MVLKNSESNIGIKSNSGYQQLLAYFKGLCFLLSNALIQLLYIVCKFLLFHLGGNDSVII